MKCVCIDHKDHATSYLATSNSVHESIDVIQRSYGESTTLQIKKKLK